MAHFIDGGQIVSAAMSKRELSETLVRRIKNKESFYRDRVRNGTPSTACRPLKPRFPVIDRGVTEFVSFFRDQRLPVSMSVIQERSRMAAHEHGVDGFKESRG